MSCGCWRFPCGPNYHNLHGGALSEAVLSRHVRHSRPLQRLRGFGPRSEPSRPVCGRLGARRSGAMARARPHEAWLRSENRSPDTPRAARGEPGTRTLQSQVRDGVRPGAGLRSSRFEILCRRLLQSGVVTPAQCGTTPAEFTKSRSSQCQKS